MFTRGLAVCLALVFVSVAQAGAVIGLTPTTPENALGGYLPGTVVDFQASISSDRTTPIYMRLFQLDFAASDSALTFLGPDNWPDNDPVGEVGPEDGDGSKEFVFDWSAVSVGNAFYAEYPNYPLPAVAYSPTSQTPIRMATIPPTPGTYLMGTGQVELPDIPGVYTVDALNAGTNDPQNRGAQVRFGFGGTNPITAWLAGEGNVTGGLMPLNVVPEPATLALLALGGLALLRRRTA